MTDTEEKNLMEALMQKARADLLLMEASKEMEMMMHELEVYKSNLRELLEDDKDPSAGRSKRWFTNIRMASVGNQLNQLVGAMTRLAAIMSRSQED